MRDAPVLAEVSCVVVAFNVLDVLVITRVGRRIVDDIPESVPLALVVLIRTVPVGGEFFAGCTQYEYLLPRSSPRSHFLELLYPPSPDPYLIWPPSVTVYLLPTLPPNADASWVAIGITEPSTMIMARVIVSIRLNASINLLSVIALFLLSLLLDAHECEDDHRQAENYADPSQYPAEPIGCLLAQIKLHACLVSAHDHFVIRFVVFGFRHMRPFPQFQANKKRPGRYDLSVACLSCYCDCCNIIVFLLR